MSAEVQRTQSRLDPDETTRVIAVLDPATRGAAGPSKSAIRSTRAAVLRNLPAGGYDVVSTYARIPVVSLEVDAAGLSALAADPRVVAVQKDHMMRLQMTEANALTRVNDVHALGITGEGVTVAIIDSGVDSDAGVVHPGLADDLLGEACFRVEEECVGGPTSAEDQFGHGTHVAGIITGPNGVAPDAQFYALKVFSDSGWTSDTDVLNALDYVLGLNTVTPGTVDLVNLSLGIGGGGTAADCNAADPAYQTAFGALNAQDVAVFAATGNDADIASVDAPACVDGAIGVGSTGDATFTESFENCTDDAAADKVSCYSNATPVQGAGELVDLLAPGCSITSLWLDGAMSKSLCGTSMATPYALGVGALVLADAADRGTSFTPTALEELLEASGEPVSDYRYVAGPTFPRVAALNAVSAVDLEVPAGLQVTGTTDTVVSLGWTGTASADHYSLTRTSTRSGETVVLTSATTSYDDTTVPCGEFAYAVHTIAADGRRSLWSDRVTATARPCPAAPTNPTLTPVDADTQQLGWTASATAGVSTVVERRRTGGVFTEVAVAAPGAVQVEDSVVGCGRVDYRLVSRTAGGDVSEPSAVVSRSFCVPGNDDIAHATVITPGATGTSVTETEAHGAFATEAATDPEVSCAFNGNNEGYQTVWFSITPTAQTRVAISTEATTLEDPAMGYSDTLLSVHSGPPGPRSEVGCNDDVSGRTDHYLSRLAVNLEAGTTYYVQVAERQPISEQSPGNLVTEFSWLDYLPGPPNDLVENATEITTTPYAVTVTNPQLAGTSPADPQPTCVSGGPLVGHSTLWWTFTPWADGSIDLDTNGSSGSYEDTIASVLTGSPGSFTSVACSDDEGTGYQSLLTDIAVEAGTTYSILVSRWGPVTETTAGTALLHLDFAADPGVIVSDSAVTVEEGGATDSYTVRLATAPTSDVVVSATGDADCEPSPSSLTFTTADYSAPQTITVSAVADGDDTEGTHSCTITHAATSADPDYDGVAVDAVRGTVLDRLQTSVAISTPADGATFTQGDTVLADYACTDDRGGTAIASCAGAVADGSAIDTTTPGPHTFTVTLTRVGGGATAATNSYTVVATPVIVTGRPDLRVKLAGAGPLLGDDVFGSADGQTAAGSARRGSKVSYGVSVQNDADEADRIQVGGGATRKGFTVRYWSPDGIDITSAVTDGTFSTPDLAPGRTYAVRVVVTVTRKAKASLWTNLTAVSASDPSAVDAARLVTERK